MSCLGIDTHLHALRGYSATELISAGAIPTALGIVVVTPLLPWVFANPYSTDFSDYLRLMAGQRIIQTVDGGGTADVPGIHRVRAVRNPTGSAAVEGGLRGHCGGRVDGDPTEE